MEGRKGYVCVRSRWVVEIGPKELVDSLIMTKSRIHIGRMNGAPHFGTGQPATEAKAGPTLPISAALGLSTLRKAGW
jgi:hypothetical protein